MAKQITIPVTQQDIRERLTLRVRMPPLIGPRLHVGSWVIRIGAAICGVGIEIATHTETGRVEQGGAGKK